MSWKRIYIGGYKFKVPSGVNEIGTLVVAGGGGGGNGTTSMDYCGGGGGAGGLIFIENYSVSPFQEFDVEIGKGGLGSGSTKVAGQTGEDSKFGSLIAKGGGGGGGPECFALDGGSGGGAGRNSYHPEKTALGKGIQSDQSGDSGLYGFGNDGGVSGTTYHAGGGGGADGVGTSGRECEGMGPGKEIWGVIYAIGGAGQLCFTYAIPYTGNGGSGDRPLHNKGEAGMKGVVLIKVGAQFYRFVGETWSQKLWKKDDVILYDGDTYIALYDTEEEPSPIEPLKGRRAGFINFF